MDNQELVKQLGDAGYKFGVSHFGGKYSQDAELEIPTLSELIEACGDGFKRLRRVVDARNGKAVFHAIGRKGGKNLDPIMTRTPEEAVAKLWLALNKK